MKVDIPAETWGAIVGTSVMRAITDENRDVLVKEAITHLLTPEKHSAYGPSRTPLQEAFDTALAQKAREFVRAELDGEIGEKVREIVQESIVKAFDSERRDALVGNIADAIVKAFRVDGY